MPAYEVYSLRVDQYGHPSLVYEGGATDAPAASLMGRAVSQTLYRLLGIVFDPEGKLCAVYQRGERIDHPLPDTTLDKTDGGRWWRVP